MKIPATWTERDVITSTSSCMTSHQHPKQPKKSKPQQCLRFAPTVEVVEVPNRFDYSREEVEATWFQGEDYDDFRETSYMTMGLYRAGLLAKHEGEHCIRGLECRLNDTARWTRYHATAAVLNEQYRQYRFGYYNPQAIADLYHAVSWKSQYTAYTQAMLDEQEQQPATTLTAFSPRRQRKSDAKNLLRKVIDIERLDDMDSSSTSCSFQSSLLQPATDFDITSFFQEATIPAQ